MLSDEFYREIVAHPIPADMEAVKVLASAPAVLDLFMWLSYRCFVAKGKETIPLFGPRGLASQIGSIEYARPRKFREKLDQWLGIDSRPLAGVPGENQPRWHRFRSQSSHCRASGAEGRRNGDLPCDQLRSKQSR